VEYPDGLRNQLQLAKPRATESATAPGFPRRALTAELDDPDRVDDNRFIAAFTAEILAGRA
jgi:hypothetical protein